MSNATIKQYGEMGIRLETLHNSHQMSSWPCSALVNHFIIHTLYRAPQMFKMFEKHSVILDQTQARPRTVMIWMISVVWEGVSVGQSPWCWDDCWNAEQTEQPQRHNTPQLTGRGWALIWECQNLLLSAITEAWRGRVFVCKWNILAMCVYVTYKWAYLE